MSPHHTVMKSYRNLYPEHLLSSLLREQPQIVGFVAEPHRSSRYNRLRSKLLQKTGGVCAYCAERMTAETVTIDHVLPIGRGGSDEWDNLLPACEPCNQRKRNDPPELWPIHERAKP